MIQFIDGFDYYATADIDKKWDAVNGSPAINPTGGRNGGGAIEFDTASEYAEKDVTGTPATIIVGLAVKVSSLSVSQDVLYLMDGASVQVKIRIRTDGKIEAYRDTTLLGTSSGTVFSAGSYAHLDCKITINNSSGSVLVVSGATTHLNLTSQDTQTSANAQVTAVRIGGDGTNTVSVDDFYILDTTGSVNNDQIGDCRVDVLRPTTEASYSDLTPSSGVDNSAMVDDATPDGDSTYNSSSAVGAKDTYGYEPLTDIGGSEIFGVQLNMVVRKDSSGTRKVRAVARPASTNYFGGSQDLNTSYLNQREIWEQNPETAAEWAETEINSSQFGVEVAS